MAAPYDKEDISAGYGAQVAINGELEKISNAFETVLNKDDATDNTMNVDLDMGGNQILNLPAATDPTDPIRLTDLDTLNPETVVPAEDDYVYIKDVSDSGKFKKSLVMALGNPSAGMAEYQPLDPTLTALAALITSANKLIYSTGSDSFTTTDLTISARELLDDVTFADMRSTLDVDQAGTDNSTPVTLGGSYDYLTLSDQEITLNPIDLTADVSGTLPESNGGTGVTDLSTLPVSSLNVDIDYSDVGADPAGTDNSTDVTLAGTYDYLSLIDQEITLDAIDLTTDVQGILPESNGGTGVDDMTTINLSYFNNDMDYSDFAAVGTAHTGTVSIDGQFNTDNLRLDGNTLLVTNTNGNLTVSANGTGNVFLQSNSLTRLTTRDGGINIYSNGSTDSENRYVVFKQQGGSDRAYVGHAGDGVLNLRNLIHGGNVSISGENTASGAFRNMLLASPDGAVTQYYDGTATARTKSNGFEVFTGSTWYDAVTSIYSGTVSITGQLNVDNLRLDGNTISSTNANGNVEILPNGTGAVRAYYNSLVRISTGANGTIGIHSDGNTDAEQRLLVFRHQNGSTRGFVGHGSSSTLIINNSINSGSITATGTNSGGSPATIFTGSPDGAAALYNAGTATARTASSALQVHDGTDWRTVNHTHNTSFTNPPIFPAYTVAGLPTASSYTNGVVIVTNEVGGRTLATSDGTNWRRVSDGAIVSA